MAMEHDVTGHPLLSDAARTLSTADLRAFEAHIELAERMLGLRGLNLSEEQAGDAAMAIVLQVNHQLLLRANPEIVLLQSESRGPISKTYRTDMFGMGPGGADPTAVSIAQRIRGSGAFSATPSMRR